MTNTAIRGAPTETQRAIYRHMAQSIRDYIIMNPGPTQGQWYLCTHLNDSIRQLGLDVDSNEVKARFFRDLALPRDAGDAPFLAEHVGNEDKSNPEYADLPHTTQHANINRHLLLLDLASKRKERVQDARWYARRQYLRWDGVV